MVATCLRTSRLDVDGDLGFSAVVCTILFGLVLVVDSEHVFVFALALMFAFVLVLFVCNTC